MLHLIIAGEGITATLETLSVLYFVAFLCSKEHLCLVWGAASPGATQPDKTVRSVVWSPRKNCSAKGKACFTLNPPSGMWLAGLELQSDTKKGWKYSWRRGVASESEWIFKGESRLGEKSPISVKLEHAFENLWELSTQHNPCLLAAGFKLFILAAPLWNQADLQQQLQSAN